MKKGRKGGRKEEEGGGERSIFKSTHDRACVSRESHNYYPKRRLGRARTSFFRGTLARELFLFPLVVFRGEIARASRVRSRRDDEFDTLARSLARSSDRNCRLETERTSGKGGAPDKRRIIDAVDKAISTNDGDLAPTTAIRSNRFRRRRPGRCSFPIISPFDRGLAET